MFKVTFINFFTSEESFEKEVSIVLLEKFIDYNKFKEVKQFIREKKSGLSAEVYDNMISQSIERCFKFSHSTN